MHIKPIKSKSDYKSALAEIESLWESKPGTLNGDKLDVLTTLVESYEQKLYPILPPDPIEAIKFRMEQQGLTNSDVAILFGGRNRVTEVLHKKRSLTVRMIKALHTKLNIPAESLLA